ncbi:helix-turn-helix domain-containing protein [Methanobrevibacter curvatus]|uniref:Winged helix-turn helix domain-containing protein n=1 Tax=Methanobrevibacter curvatus TaxID=49547 RepID=A0A162FNR8_9EURY|nr:helix-turn-helix domain-containing protein [Methanobrevibacter curvatus]KZX12810.1 hypothetical protein MBCUR_08660 [Methanobrevibacter curvatus]
MVNMVQKKVADFLSDDELEEIIKNNKKNCKLFQKLIFIRAVKKGYKVSDACDFLQISEPTGHRWLDNYNEKGLAGLSPNYEKVGRPSKMSEEDKEEFFKIIENEDNLTPQRAHSIIKNRYNIDYSIRHVCRIVESGGYNYGKAYQIFSQKPDNADKELKKT